MICHSSYVQILSCCIPGCTNDCIIVCKGDEVICGIEFEHVIIFCICVIDILLYRIV